MHDEPIGRRRFLGTAGSGLAAALAAGAGRGRAQDAPPARPDAMSPAYGDGNPAVSLVHGPVEAALRLALEPFGGMSAFVKPGATVLVKPNVSFPNPKTWGSGTSPECVRAVALAALEAGAGRVIVADHTMREGLLSFERSGLVEALDGIERLKIVSLQDETFFTEVPVPGGRALKTVKVARLALKADTVINVPAAKSHSATEVSFGLKNQMGLVWDRSFFHTGTDLHAAVAELLLVLRPALTVLDATRAMLTGGPAGPGKVQELNLLAAGTDPVAVDAVAAGLAAWNNRSIKPGAVRHLAAAAELGLGVLDAGRIRVLRSES